MHFGLPVLLLSREYFDLGRVHWDSLACALANRDPVRLSVNVRPHPRACAGEDQASVEL